MYAKYVWLNGATQAQMLDDVCKLLSGSPVSALSASCDKVNSQVIANTLANNWTIFDNAASASAKVLRSLNTDGTYKFAHLSIVGNNLAVTAFESWNASTHVGTNQAFASTAFAAQYIASAFAVTGGTVYLYAQNSVLFAGTSTDTVAVVEWTKETPTMDGSYPSVAVIPFSSSSISTNFDTVASSTAKGVGLCRVKYCLADGNMTLGSSPAQTFLSHAVVQQPGPLGAVPDVSGVIKYFATKLQIFSGLGRSQSNNPSRYPLRLGTVLALRFVTFAAAINQFDEMQIDGAWHVLVRFNVTQVGGAVAYAAFPKG